MTEPGAAAPIRRSESRAAQENPDGTIAPLEGLRTVLLWTITDAFGLVAEEIMWTGYHLDEILAPLMSHTPTNVPLTVRHEMLDGFYTRELDAIEARDDRTLAGFWDSNATHATVSDWAGVTMQMISECYQMRPLEESTMHGKIVGLLRELGVDNAKNPRPARYLPNDVRHRLNHKGG